MDSFNTGSVAPPLTTQAPNVDSIRDAVAKLEADVKSKGTTLSGRIIHLCHYLPIVSTLQRTAQADKSIPSPPGTPEHRAIDAQQPAPMEKGPFTWHLTPRRGHTAMHSGIRSLSATHKQVIVAYTGDIHAHSPHINVPEIVGGGAAAPGVETVSTEKLTAEEKAGLGEAMKTFKEAGSQEYPNDMEYVPVWLTDKTARGHYDGYCKATLWPLFHYLLWQDVTNEISSHDGDFNAYLAANLEYAHAVAKIYQPGDLIWIQDYHLLLLPKLIRQHHPDAHIGLFVHTPFPSSEVFRALPRRREILDGMLGASLVCFQTYSYSRHFASSCVRVCGYETAAGYGTGMGGIGVTAGQSTAGGKVGHLGIDVHGHVVEIMHCPVGIDAERVEMDSRRPGIKPKLDALRSLYKGKKIIVGRDKLDAVKGVAQKLKAFEKLLLEFPEWRGNVVLIQVTSPALSDSPKLERQVSELVAHINGEYGSLDFIPVHHYHQHIKKDEFYALLSVADLALITPLRDGMNTTSMEFVICQQQAAFGAGGAGSGVDFEGDVVRSPAKSSVGGVISSVVGGVKSVAGSAAAAVGIAMNGTVLPSDEIRAPSPLVMSEFMGISNAMSKGALQINPWNLGEVAEAINHGLTMDVGEKIQRHELLYKAVTTHTTPMWAGVLIKSLLEKIGGENTAHQTPVLDRTLMGERYASAGKRLFMFDYDGTLTPIVKVPSMATPSRGTLTALTKLAADPKNVVYIISGRNGDFLDEHLGHLTNVGFSAEHGCFVREPGAAQGTWKNLTKTFDMSWMAEVEEIFKYYTERTTGSFIELKNASITWHYRAADPEWGSFQCKQCLDLLETNLVPKRPIEVLVGKKNLEVRPIAINKGEIVKRLLYLHPDAEFAFCAGDDKTDEDMFRALCILRPSVVESQQVIMQPPVSASLMTSPNSTPPELKAVELVIKPDAVFSTAVGPPTKKTLAFWHDLSPREIVQAMLELVGEGNSPDPGLPQKDGEPIEQPAASAHAS
ncbi:threalose-6-phosphate phosphatase [Tulasnella sp. 330]|nr:threalose-6-phosphate phosphatase [Tulasnella sp. 330]KAG8879552.1 threalose-6-phosphate phosphatase [Tulasnella sp. 331]KAG8885847.1 threalose-6-phosphate phosphatase [Tulasnella sp. 332]